MPVKIVTVEYYKTDKEVQLQAVLLPSHYYKVNYCQATACSVSCNIVGSAHKKYLNNGGYSLKETN